MDVQVVPTIGVIGGEGFIGSNLVKDLQAISITKDTYYKTLCHYDTLINAAGNSNKRLADTDPLGDFDLSVRSVLESVSQMKYDTYIYISSCEVYGDLTGNTKEDAELDVTKMSRYGLSKYLAECIVKQYCKKWLILRVHAVIGSGMKKGPVFDILKGDKLWLNAASEFQFTHTSYISEFIRTVLDIGIVNETFNLTSYDRTPLYEAMNVLGRVVKAEPTPTVIHAIDVKKASALVLPPTSLENLKQVRKDYEA